MIIGKGLLASSFEPHYGHRPEIIVFAAGVSNSTQTDPSEFLREKQLLQRTLEQFSDVLGFVYFGSCGVASGQASPYMSHKREMERLVLDHRAGLVLRLPQVVSPSSNPTTLTNYLAKQVRDGELITLWKFAQRNLIDIDDIVPIAKHIIDNRPDFPSCVAIASSNTLTMPELVGHLERVLGKRARMELVDRGEPMPIDNQHSLQIAKHLGLDLEDGYAQRVLKKYYGTTPNA